MICSQFPIGHKSILQWTYRVKRILLHQTSLGYIAPGLLPGSKPDQPSMLSSFFGTENLSGSNSFGRSQKYGDRWRLYTCRARIYHKASNGMDQTIYNAAKFRAICAAQVLTKVPRKKKTLLLYKPFQNCNHLAHRNKYRQRISGNSNTHALYLRSSLAGRSFALW